MHRARRQPTLLTRAWIQQWSAAGSPGAAGRERGGGRVVCWQGTGSPRNLCSETLCGSQFRVEPERTCQLAEQQQKAQPVSLIRQNNIEGIKARQVEKAQEVIQLQFKMEKLVFCQDQIYSTVLKDVRLEALQPLGKPPLVLSTATPSAKVSTISEIGAHVEAYCLETSKRLSNQIPFIIQFFILRENGDYLQKAMMKILQEKERYSWLLQEHRETATKRKALKERLFRLAQARRTLWQFSKGGVY